MDRAQGLAKVMELVMECLDLEDDEITAESRIITDLGADSLDFIDLTFNIEDTFGVKLRGGDFDLLAQIDVSKPEVALDGVLTPAAREQLTEWMPTLAAMPADDPVTTETLFSLITVDTLWRVVEWRLNG